MGRGNEKGLKFKMGCIGVVLCYAFSEASRVDGWTRKKRNKAKKASTFQIANSTAKLSSNFGFASLLLFLLGSDFSHEKNAEMS